ncbi:WD40 repeat domain-containing protein [Aeoliella sp.]|uniref:WD40 repeat domain-containing protein n=1 Tax=Aeoliella sp. TaxID=2795800 RepID=UPI003CCB9060
MKISQHPCIHAGILLHLIMAVPISTTLGDEIVQQRVEGSHSLFPEEAAIPSGARQILSDLDGISNIQLGRDGTRLLVEFSKRIIVGNGDTAGVTVQGKDGNRYRLSTAGAIYDRKSQMLLSSIDEDLTHCQQFEMHEDLVAVTMFTPQLAEKKSKPEEMAAKLQPQSVSSPQGPQGTYDIRLYDTSRKDWRWIAGISQSGYEKIAFSKDGQTVLSTEFQRNSLVFKTWDSKTGELLRTVDGPQLSSSDSHNDFESQVLENLGFENKTNLSTQDIKLCISDDVSLAAYWFEEMPVKICDVETGRVIRSIDLGQHVEQVAFSPTGKQLALAVHATPKSVVSVWDVKSGERVLSIVDLAYRLGFSPDGTKLWTSDVLDKSVYLQRQETRGRNPLENSGGAEASYNVSVWDCSNGKRVRKIETGLFRTGVVAFLSESELMTTGTLGNLSRIYVWDLKSDAVP